MIVVVAPLIQLVVFGYVATLDVRHLRLGRIPGLEGPEDRAVVQRLVGSGVFDRTRSYRSLREAEAAFRRQEVDALWIHRGEKRVLWVNGVNERVVATVLQWVPRVMARVAGENQTIPVKQSLVYRILYNPSLRSTAFMLPGVALMIVLISVAVLSAVALVREQERGTLELLQMTPLHPQEILLGKLLPYAVVGWINAWTVLGLAHVLFGLPLGGSLTAVGVALALYVAVTATMALWVSSFSQTQQQAMLTILGILLPMVLFSGLFFPIESMPGVFQYFAWLDPLAHALRILRGILLGGFAWWVFLPSYAVLAAYAVGFAWMGVSALRVVLQGA
jgi:ABC-2 type transport system permease protein